MTFLKKLKHINRACQFNMMAGVPLLAFYKEHISGTATFVWNSTWKLSPLQLSYVESTFSSRYPSQAPDLVLSQSPALLSPSLYMWWDQDNIGNIAPIFMALSLLNSFSSIMFHTNTHLHAMGVANYFGGCSSHSIPEARTLSFVCFAVLPFLYAWASNLSLLLLFLEVLGQRTVQMLLSGRPKCKHMQSGIGGLWRDWGPSWNVGVRHHELSPGSRNVYMQSLGRCYVESCVGEGATAAVLFSCLYIPFTWKSISLASSICFLLQVAGF